MWKIQGFHNASGKWIDIGDKLDDESAALSQTGDFIDTPDDWTVMAATAVCISHFSAFQVVPA